MLKMHSLSFLGKTIVDKMNESLNELCIYLTSNRLKLNVLKTKFIYIGRKVKCHTLDYSLELVTVHFEYLEMILDKNMKYMLFS